MITTAKMIYQILGIATIAVIGSLVIPPLIKKYGNKMYKSSLNKDEIDFESLGPEIVEKEETKED